MQYGIFDEDVFLLHQGRMATGSGLIGLIAGFVFSLVMGFGKIGIIISMFIAFYLFLTGFWGAYKLNLWYRKYKYQLPDIAWHILRVPTVIAGALMGIIGWGGFEHFILLLAMEADYKGGMLACQFILIPMIGPHLGKKLARKKKNKQSNMQHIQY